MLSKNGGMVQVLTCTLYWYIFRYFLNFELPTATLSLKLAVVKCLIWVISSYKIVILILLNPSY